jgi:hypothetical protein
MILPLRPPIIACGRVRVPLVMRIDRGRGVRRFVRSRANQRRDRECTDSTPHGCRSVAPAHSHNMEVDSAARQWGITDIQQWAVFSTDQASRFTAGAFGFLTLAQCGEWPPR